MRLIYAPQIGDRLGEDGKDFVAQFNRYADSIFGNRAREGIEITQEPGTSYLKVSMNGTTLMTVYPDVLVKSLAQPLIERSGVSFNLMQARL